MKRKLLSKILNDAVKLPTVNEKVAFLIHNDSEELRILLQIILNKKVKWLIPVGPPRGYKPQENLDANGSLYYHVKKIHHYLSINGIKTEMADQKRLNLFIGMLESIHPDDANLIMSIKDDRFEKDKISKAVKQAFKGLIK